MAGLSSSDKTSLARRLRRIANELAPQAATGSTAYRGTKPGTMAAKGGKGGKKKRATTRRTSTLAGASPQ
jgi:hypothetical protein